MVDLKDLAIVLAVSTATAFLFTWVVRGIMRRAGIYDRPSEERKLHGKPIAYEGGLAMFVALLAGIITTAILQPRFAFTDTGELRFVEFTGLIIGSTCIVALGAADDLLDLAAWLKLILQLGIAAMMSHFGFGIDVISNPFGDQLVIPEYVSIGLTAIWYALLMNGINMIDGLDGLAAGIVAITGITLLAVAIDLQQPMGAFLAIILVGICLGFLPFNFAPASIFMGDAGSLLLGFLLASITLLSSSKSPALLALVIPVLAVGVPIFETLFAFFRRAVKGQHPFKADRRHLHHRFLALGFSPRRTVLLFYYITAYFGVSAYVLQRLETRATLALVVIIFIGMLVLVETLRFLERVHK